MKNSKLSQFFCSKNLQNDGYDFNNLSAFDQICLIKCLQWQDNKKGYCPFEVKIKDCELAYDFDLIEDFKLTEVGKRFLQYCKETDEANREFGKPTIGYRALFDIIKADTSVHSSKNLVEKYVLYKLKQEKRYRSTQIETMEDKSVFWQDSNGQKKLTEYGKKDLILKRSEYIYMTFYNESHKKLQLEKE